MSDRPLKDWKDCLGCMAHSDTGMAGYHMTAHCKLEYQCEYYPWPPHPCEPCPKPFQWRTFEKSPRKEESGT